ncbi:amidase domain-containing protein [Paenibacillus plantiphilus]|nr:amidase domain-containing protein [Paenibacillus plantiphilus]
MLVFSLSVILLFSICGTVFATEQKGATQESKVDLHLIKKIDSFLQQRGEQLKTMKIGGLLTKYDEALGLIKLMKEVHSQGLVNYETKYLVKKTERTESLAIVTIELYQIFTWEGTDVVTEFKDDVTFSIDSSDEISSINIPQLSIDSDQIVSNGKRLKEEKESEKSLLQEMNQSSPIQTLSSYTFNRGAVKNYVDTYWDNYNTTYYEYSNDCTNFASQAIHAGGIPMYIHPVGGGATDNNPSWYLNIYSNGLLRSVSWINVDYLFDLMRNYNTIDAEASNHASMQIGDIIQYDRSSNGTGKDHTAIVSEIYYVVINGVLDRRVSVSYHTTDRHNIPYDYYATQNPTTTIYYTHIKDTQN